MSNKLKFNIGEFYYRMQNGGDCTDEEARIVFEKYPRAMQLLDSRYFTEEFVGEMDVENIIANVPINCFEKIFKDIETRKLAYDCVQTNSKLYQSVGINRLDADIMRYMMYLHVEDMMVYQTSLSNEHYRILINTILDYFNAPRQNYNAWAVAIKEGDSPDGMAGILYSVNGVTRYKKLGPAFRHISYEYSRLCKPKMNGNKEHDMKIFFKEMINEANARRKMEGQRKLHYVYWLHKNKLFHKHI